MGATEIKNCEVLPNYLLEIIHSGENINVEFKEAKKTLPSSLFETVCSMLNRNGGHIFLGVNDAREIIGVYKNYIEILKKEFVDLCNNPQKIFPIVYLDIKEYVYEEKILLYIYVHESSDVHHTANKIYDRNEDGDFDITGSTTLVSNLYIQKSSTYIENKIYPYVTFEDLREDLIETARKMAINRITNHPWQKMNNMDLLRSVGLYDKDFQTGKEGFNLACILIFGKDEVIQSVLSYYKTDALLRIEDKERYDDRDDIRTNLLESYQRLVAFISKHLSDKFYLEGDKSISTRDIISRELCANLLMHREYANPYPARLIITENSIFTENASKPRTVGYINIDSYSPYAKNPKIARVFKEIGLADELGSGIKKIVKYTKIYSGGVPKFLEGEVFKVDIPLQLYEENHYISSFELRKLVLDFIAMSNGRTRKEINDYIYPMLNEEESLMHNRVRTSLSTLKSNGLIENVGNDSKPLWKKKQ